MNNRDFSDIPIEKDTKLFSRNLIELNGIPCAHENWEWDGVWAESLIFYKEDLKDLNEDGIFDFVSTHKKITRSDSTIMIKDKFIFVNYNFEVK